MVFTVEGIYMKKKKEAALMQRLVQNKNKFNYGIGVLLRTGFGSSFQFINRKQN